MPDQRDDVKMFLPIWYIFLKPISTARAYSMGYIRRGQKSFKTAPKGEAVLRIDGAYLYNFGGNMQPFSALPEKDYSLGDIYFDLHAIKFHLEQFIYQSIFTDGWKTIHSPATEFLTNLNKYLPEPSDGEIDWSQTVPGWQITSLKTSFKKFEAVMTAELQSSALYYVSSKGGFDTASLTDSGDRLFPADLASKVPTAIPDVQAGARCIAFDLPTASGFHLHRANESVLRVYWDNVTDNAPHPDQSNMGVYLAELNKRDAGKKEVREHLKSIKDFHRNPLMHPDQVLESVDQAIDLMAAIRCSIGYMLREIKAPD